MNSKLSNLMLFAVSVVLAACGSGSGREPLPLGEGTPQAYTEAHLVENPGALLRPQHLVVTQLEAGEHAGYDTGAFGVDVLPYHLDAPIVVELSIHENAPLVSHLVVQDASGEELGRHSYGEPATTLALSPGEYYIELHHAQAGDSSAPRQMVFFQLAEAPPSEAMGRVASRKASDGHLEAVLAAGTVSTTCVGCDFSNSNQTGHDFRSAVLSRSSFYNAILDAADFTGAQCDQCDFSGPSKSSSGTIFSAATLDAARFSRSFLDTSFRGASLVGASLRQIVCLRCNFSSEAGRVTNLRNADLSNSNFGATFFENADLTGADITQANLDLANRLRLPLPLTYFRGASLVDLKPAGYFLGKDLSNLDLSGTRWSGMDLYMVDLSKAFIDTPPDLTGAVLSAGWSGANLSGIRFSNKTVFAGMDLRLVNFGGASLYEADLHDADLSGARLTGADLSFANLSGAKMVGTQAGVAPGSGAPAAQFFGAYMPNADLTDADLRSANLAGAHLYGDRALLVRTRLDAANLDHALLAGVMFGSASLNDASFDTAVLVNARFDNASLSNTKFNSAYLQGAAFDSAAAVEGVSLSNAAVSLADSSWGFTEQDGTPFTYGFGPTKLGVMGTSSTINAICPNSEMAPCTGSKLTPLANGPFPPQPACVAAPPRYDNCVKPAPG